MIIALLATAPVVLGQRTFSNKLVIPPLLNPKADKNGVRTFDLKLAPGKTTFKGDTIYINKDTLFNKAITVETYGYNQAYLGPTLVMNRDDSVQLNVTNHLPDITTTHWHGLHVSPKNDGGPHTAIYPDSTWRPSFVIRDSATTYWYHPHLHHKTQQHVTMGAAGLIILRDQTEAKLKLPRTYGVDDFPLVLQDKAFIKKNGSYEIAAKNSSGNNMLVNGTLNPYLEVPRQVVRFRVLNGATKRVFYLQVKTKEEKVIKYYQIGSDGGLFAKPVPFDPKVSTYHNPPYLMLASGERAEILVDFSPYNVGDELTLVNVASGLPEHVPGKGKDVALLRFKVIQRKNNIANFLTQSPQNLALVQDNIKEDYLKNPESIVHRKKVLRVELKPLKFTINHKKFDMERIDDIVGLNNVEIWTISTPIAEEQVAHVAHPFHIHDVQFYILDITDPDGVTRKPPAYLAGRKDVVLVRPGYKIRFIAKFDDFADSKIPYMYHCHFLDHEDKGMMGQFIVVSNKGTNPMEKHRKK